MLRDHIDIDNKVLLNLVTMSPNRPTTADRWIESLSHACSPDQGVIVDCVADGPKILAARTFFTFIAASEIKIIVYVMRINDKYGNIDKEKQTELGQERVDFTKTLLKPIVIDQQQIIGQTKAGGKRGFELVWNKDKYTP